MSPPVPSGPVLVPRASPGAAWSPWRPKAFPGLEPLLAGAGGAEHPCSGGFRPAVRCAVHGCLTGAAHEGATRPTAGSSSTRLPSRLRRAPAFPAPSSPPSWRDGRGRRRIIPYRTWPIWWASRPCTTCGSAAWPLPEGVPPRTGPGIILTQTRSSRSDRRPEGELDPTDP